MVKAHATPARRMGPAGSAIWEAMIDGAEAILQDQGHAALTSRRVAEQIGVKQRLVYYYFHTMDDLIVAAFKRLSERELHRLAGTLASPRPLHEIWEVCINRSDARLVSEFMALAHRIDALKVEVIRFIEQSRKLQIEALSAAFGRGEPSIAVPAPAIALIATSLALSLVREAELGITLAHQDTMSVIERFIALCEPAEVEAGTREPL